jgi:hypothetical protein
VSDFGDQVGCCPLTRRLTRPQIWGDKRINPRRLLPGWVDQRHVESEAGKQAVSSDLVHRAARSGAQNDAARTVPANAIHADFRPIQTSQTAIAENIALTIAAQAAICAQRSVERCWAASR